MRARLVMRAQSAMRLGVQELRNYQSKEAT